MEIRRPPEHVNKPTANLAAGDVSTELEPVRTGTVETKGPAQNDPQRYTVYLGPKLGSRVYEFPTHFKDVEMMAAQFVLPSRAVRSWLEERAPELEPTSMLGMTRGMVTVQHLANPAQMDPYFEGSFAVHVRRPDGTEGWHVLEMPVTSEENRERGRRIFGYAKEMAQVEIEDAGRGRLGTVSTEERRPLFSLGVKPLLPFGIGTDRKNHNIQRLNGRLVDLESRIEGSLTPGLGRVEFGEEMQRLYPGLPRRPTVLFGARITGADLFLSLPRGSDGRMIVPPSTDPRIL